jgi:hypothetical protein
VNSQRNWWSFRKHEIVKRIMNLKYSMKMMLKKSSANQNQHISRIPKCARCRNHGIIRWCSESLSWKSEEMNVEFPQWTERTQKVVHLQELSMSKVWFDLRTPKDNGSAGNRNLSWESRRILSLESCESNWNDSQEIWIMSSDFRCLLSQVLIVCLLET